MSDQEKTEDCGDDSLADIFERAAQAVKDMTSSGAVRIRLPNSFTVEQEALDTNFRVALTHATKIAADLDSNPYPTAQPGEARAINTRPHFTDDQNAAFRARVPSPDYSSCFDNAVSIPLAPKAPWILHPDGTREELTPEQVAAILRQPGAGMAPPAMEADRPWPPPAADLRPSPEHAGELLHWLQHESGSHVVWEWKKGPGRDGKTQDRWHQGSTSSWAPDAPLTREYQYLGPAKWSPPVELVPEEPWPPPAAEVVNDEMREAARSAAICSGYLPYDDGTNEAIYRAMHAKAPVAPTWNEIGQPEQMRHEAACRVIDLEDALAAKDARIAELDSRLARDRKILCAQVADLSQKLRAAFVDPDPPKLEHTPFKDHGHDPRRMGPL